MLHSDYQQTGREREREWERYLSVGKTFLHMAAKLRQKVFKGQATTLYSSPSTLSSTAHSPSQGAEVAHGTQTWRLPAVRNIMAKCQKQVKLPERKSRIRRAAGATVESAVQFVTMRYGRVEKEENK